LFLLRHLAYQRQRPPEDSRARELWHYLQETLADPLVGLRLMYDRAEDNLRRYKARQPLVGHLLPYLTAEDAPQEGLPCHEERGWIEQA